MDAKGNTLLRGIQSKDEKLVLRSLSRLRNLIYFYDDGHLYRGPQAGHLLRAMLELLHLKSMPEGLLELNVKLMLFILQLEPNSLPIVKSEDYTLICQCLEGAALSTKKGRKFAKHIIKFLEYITQKDERKECLGKVVPCITGYVRALLEDVHTDDVQSGMNIICSLCRRWDPHVETMRDWVEKISGLLNHRNSKVVARKALRSLSSIFKRCLSYGFKLSCIITDDVAILLSRQLSLASRRIRCIQKSGLPFYYSPPLLEVARFYSHEEMESNEEEGEEEEAVREMQKSEKRAALISANNLLNIYTIMCNQTSDVARLLSLKGQQLVFALISLLQVCEERGTMERVLLLLQIIVTKLSDNGEMALSGGQYCGVNDWDSGYVDAGTVREGKEAEVEVEVDGKDVGLKDYLGRLFFFKSAVEAVKQNDKDLLNHILSEGFDLRWVDNHGQSLLHWSIVCGTCEMVEMLCSRCEAKPVFGMKTASAHATVCGEEKTCRILQQQCVDASGVRSVCCEPMEMLEKLVPHGYEKRLRHVEELLLQSSEGSLLIACGGSNLQRVRICGDEKKVSGEMQLAILAVEVIPVLVGVFEQSSSESVRYRAIQIIRVLVSRLSAKSVYQIGRYGVGLNGRLMEMIMLALSRETETIVDSALQVCYQLARKAGSLYLPLMSRSGIMRMIGKISQVLQLPKYDFRVVGRGKRGGCKSDGITHASDAASISNPPLPDYECDEGVEEDMSVEHEEYAEVEKEIQFCSSDEAEDADYREVPSMVGGFILYWQNWNIAIFGDVLFVFSDRAVVLFDMTREDNILSGCYLLASASGSDLPVEFRGEVERVVRSGGGLRDKVLQVIDQLKHISGRRSMECLWPCHVMNEDRRRRVYDRGRALWRMRLSCGEECRRHNSVPPSGTYQPIGREFKEDTIMLKMEVRKGRCTRTLRAGNLLLDMIQAKSGVPFMRVRPRVEGVDVFLFSSRGRQGFFKLRQCSDVSAFYHERINRRWQREEGQVPVGVYMDEQIWLVHSSSGSLDRHLPQVPKNGSSNSRRSRKMKANQEDMLKLSSSILKMVEPCTEKSMTTTTTTASVEGLKEIVRRVIGATKRCGKEEAVEDLRWCFNSLAEIMGRGNVEEEVMPQEISSSGLISGLLLCLSTSLCRHWRNVIGSRELQRDMEFLRLRREIFLDAMEGRSLVMLIRCLVRVVDQTESLPLHLFDQVMHPTLREHLKRNVLMCVGGEAPESSSTADVEVAQTMGVNSSSSASICVDTPELKGNVKMELDAEMEEEGGLEMLPRGLIAPPLRPRDGHEHLTGGVSGLVDRRILLLLGRWFENFHSEHCSGSVVTKQVLGGYQIDVEPMSRGESETLLSDCTSGNFAFAMIESAESFDRLQCEEYVRAKKRNDLSSTSGSEVKMTADEYMLEKMRALLRGRQIKEPVRKKFIGLSFPAGLSSTYDLDWSEANVVWPEFQLRYPPNWPVYLNIVCLRKEDSELVMELVAQREDKSVVASVRVDDTRVSIFEYILRVAEKTVESSGDLDSVPDVRLVLRYGYGAAREDAGGSVDDKAGGEELMSQSGHLLTARDLRLMRAQKKRLEQLDVVRGASVDAVRKDGIEEHLQLLQLLSKLTGVLERRNVSSGGSDGTCVRGRTSSVSVGDFVSRSLTCKLMRQLRDTLAVTGGTAVPDWCLNLTQRVTALFPYSVRYDFFKACAFGAARSILWLQSKQSNQLSGGGLGSENFRMRIDSQRMRAIHTVASMSTFLGRSDMDEDLLDWLNESEVNENSVMPRELECECHRSTIHLLMDNWTLVPRNKASDGSGHGYWPWAERVMDEHAEIRTVLDVRFQREEGIGEGPTMEFYRLLAEEFRRRSVGMWLEDGWEAIESAGDCVNPPFGLFPAPYPRDRVPLNVLRRFYIMGIAVGKALQDNRLMDLPLSRPFLKLLVAGCNGSGGGGGGGGVETEVGRGEDESVCGDEWVVGLRMVMSAEEKRECLMSQYGDPLLMGLRGGGGRGRRLLDGVGGFGAGAVGVGGGHWVSGVLDMDDFEEIQPERGKFFRQLLQVHALHEKIREKELMRSGTCVEAKMDEASLEVLQCTVRDLCIDMEFLPQSRVGSESGVRLLDEYPWERSKERRRSSEVVSVEDLANKRYEVEEENLEKVNNDNLMDYIRRTMEYCLDKGIRAQMDVFKAGLERVLPMRWLSMFTSEEMGNLIRGASDVAWTSKDLLAYITPSKGYTKSSATFLYLVEVLTMFSVEERRNFVSFVTGSSCLPMGGWRKLQPRLKVVPRRASEGPYPSVSVCSHVLVLPQYSSARDLRLYLLEAMAQPGFQLS